MKLDNDVSDHIGARPARQKKKRKKKKRRRVDDDGNDQESGTSYDKLSKYELVEKEVRFSKSVLWEAKDIFYHDLGIKAWETVPNYISSNCFIAKCFANVMAAYIRDCHNTKPLSTVYIIEIGTGTGKFAFLVIKKLLEYMDTLPGYERGTEGDTAAKKTKKPPPFCFVMTDLTMKNIDYWQNNGYFDEFMEKGVVDFALYDAHEPLDIELILAKKRLSPGTLTSPMICICNYLVDSLVTDVFRMQNGQLQEMLANVSVPKGMPPSHPKFCELSKRTWTSRPIRLEEERPPRPHGCRRVPKATATKQQDATQQSGSEENSAKTDSECETKKLKDTSTGMENLTITHERDVGATADADVGDSDSSLSDSDTSSDEDDDDDDDELEPTRYYPGNDDLEDLLHHYQDVLKDSKSSVILAPVGAVQLVQSLFDLASGQSFMLLVADKAYTVPFEFRQRTPDIEVHGCFSVIANLHAIGHMFERHNGLALQNCDTSSDFKISAFIAPPSTTAKTAATVPTSPSPSSFSPTPSPSPSSPSPSSSPSSPSTPLSSSAHIAVDHMFRETRFAYRNHFIEWGPDHFFSLWDTMKVDSNPLHVLSLLRLSDFDPDMFFRFRKVLVKKLRGSPHCGEVARALALVWSRYYPNCPSSMENVPLALARVFASIDDTEKALMYFSESLRIHGSRPATLYYQARCMEVVGRNEEALAAYRNCWASPTFFTKSKRRTAVLTRKLEKEKVEKEKEELREADEKRREGEEEA
eukprot:TRINITY_DN1948_c0_g1_i2.p1 TRINITY_DN1948_c0_g1~~TRINITY_DN1948_c0_g1_i2.p1  ORF type:complete len:754 (-),score=228.89 TRINITY_DN1948_c0_g1_i2:39-2300(-)